MMAHVSVARMVRTAAELSRGARVARFGCVALNTLTGDVRFAERPTLILSRRAIVSDRKRQVSHAASRVNPARELGARSQPATNICNDNSTADASRIKPVASVGHDAMVAAGIPNPGDGVRFPAGPLTKKREPLLQQGVNVGRNGVTSPGGENPAASRRGVVLGRDGRPVRAPEAIFFEMLRCERCGASYPACGWCPFCNPRGNRR
jgi:hypothetical protein